MSKAAPGSPVEPGPDRRIFCDCQCHNQGLGNEHGGTDYNGAPRSYRELEAGFWRKHPPYVLKHDPVEAAIACSKCQHEHATALSSDPWRHTTVSTSTEAPKKYGPQGRCEPDCPFCRQLDSVAEDHKKKP